MIDVELSNCKRLYNLTAEQRDRIKSDLTFKNPAYESILKYSRWGRTKESPYLYYYKSRKDSMEVPIGYEIPFEHRSVSDSRLSVSVEYPEPRVTLREQQKNALQAFKGCLGTIVLKTGTGKSICGISLAGQLKQRALIVVNKDDLVTGWQKDIALVYGDIEVGLVKGKVFKIGEQFTITTIQTLSKLGEGKLEKLYDSISMIIADEMHHVGAKSYQVLHNFRAKYRLGLTATRMRNDGLVDTLDLLCGKVIYDGTNVESEGIISAKNIHIIRRNSDIVWRPKTTYYDVRTKKNVHSIELEDKLLVEGTREWYDYCKAMVVRGKFSPNPLRLHEAYNMIATDVNFNRQICQDVIAEYDKNESCVVFCKTIEQMNCLYESLKDRCPRIQCFYGNMKDSKSDIIARAESKEVLITLATISIACEGTNVKNWKCGFLASSVANEKDLIQILGRLRREKEGKDSVRFYDYRHPTMVGLCRHGEKRDAWYKNLGIES